ncbi:MAG: ABC-F family ATP-binding cassette domain-containing protein [Eubacteriales bacterium]|nr:ABC-F family ATP-binding cassette domain-containing protein [Eubacteriales bacterium]
MALIAVNNLSKSFGTRLLFEGVRFEVEPRDHIGLVGVNGCGKTTLFRMLLKQEQPDGGSVSISRETRLGVMAQMVENIRSTVFESTLSVFSELIETEAAIHAIEDALSLSPANALPLVSKQQALRERFAQEGGLTYKSRTRAMLLGLGFTQDELDKPMESMSGGQRNKAQLARVLLSNANVLLLDEPTNHLDIAAIQFLEDYLSAYRGAFIVISHDRYFLDKVTTKTMELKNCALTVSNGNYSRHIELQSTEQEIQKRHYLHTQREIKRIEGIIAQQRRFGQERNFITAASKQKQVERLKATLVAPEKDTASIHFHFTCREVGGNDVLLCENLSKAYEKPVFKNVNLLLKRGERVFLLGENGCGKTTLLRIIMGKEFQNDGEARFGSHVHPGYYEQHMTSMRDGNTVLGEINDAYPKLDNTQARCALAAFLFRGDDVDKDVATLSGGEKARIQLLKLMLSGANLLLLDEPTNHLDIASREALERALEEHEGTMLIVTHDRYLVNRLADRVLVMGKDGLTEHIGGYDDYMAAVNDARDEAEAVEKPNDYKAMKQRQNEINLAKGEVQRAEARIADAEAALNALQKAMAAAATDYSRVQALSIEANKKQAEIDLLYEAWDKAQKALESLRITN